MKVQQIINKATEVSKKQGWNEVEDVRRTAMLIITELSEAVQAHRIDDHADVDQFVLTEMEESDFTSFVKDTVEDELADVVIRICSFLGASCVTTDKDVENSDVRKMFEENYCKNSFAENAFIVTGNIVEAFEDKDNVNYEHLILVVSAVEAWFSSQVSKREDFDLCWHVMQKCKYNESRDYKAKY